MNSHLKISAAVAALALLIPASAIAKRPEDKPVRGQGHKHGQVNKQKKDKSLKLATANVKGVVASNDGTTMTVVVSRASGHARACKDETVSFDLTDARFHTADNTASGDMDAGDFEVDHVVKVRAKVARTKGRKTVCSLTETIVARAVHNRTTPQFEEDAAETDDEEGLDDGDELGDDEELVDGDEDLGDEEELEDGDDLGDEVDDELVDDESDF